MQSFKDVIAWAFIGLGLFVCIMLITACATLDRRPPQPFGENIWKALPYGGR